MKYLTPKEAARKWGISQRRVHTLCQEGRIKDAERHGWTWLIPEASPKPADARIKSGRYIKPKQNIAVHPTDGSVIPRFRLVEKLCPPGSSLTYIHADAGYGKTTLLLQYAKGRSDVVWLPLDERDSDTLFFLRHLEAFIRDKLGLLDFYAADYIPFAASETFASTILSALLRAIGQIKLSILMDDAHVIQNETVMDLLTVWAMECPPNISLIIASRHAPWSGLFRLKMTGRIAEFTKDDLSFSREEAEQLWGFFDEETYKATEGWTLAIQSYRLASKGHKTPSLSRIHAERDLYRYLLKEIFMQLPVKTQYFLKTTACLPVLEVTLCDSLLGICNSQAILESLVFLNIFTLRVSATSYRYHTLFSSFLQQNDDGLGRETLYKAMVLCYNSKDYEQAADYALLLDDENVIQDCIAAIVGGNTFNWVRNRSLKKQFDFLEEQSAALSPRVMLAKGMFLSDQGDFYQAEKYLSTAIPQLSSEDKKLYLRTMTHMARVLRNRVSFEESTRCIDALLPLLQNAPMQDWYGVMIEKIHNLTLTSRLSEALELTKTMMEQCLTTGAADVKAWFERYLTATYFYMGDYKNCVNTYEKSLSIPPEEQDWLMRHSIGAYAAKAYQITGQEEKVLPLLETELARLKQLGLYEEYSIYYLFHAETLHSAELLKRYLGMPFDFSTADRYLSKAEEYAVLNRSTRDHFLFVKIWRLCAGLLEQPEKAGQSISEILALLEETTPFFQSLSYGRIANALDTLDQNPEQCKLFFKQCIQIGEKIGSFAYAPIAYGRLASIYLREKDQDAAKEYTRRFLELCCQFEHHYYLRFKPLFASVLKLAGELSITPDFTRKMLSYGGYTAERVYIHTLGSFYISPTYDKGSPVKIRTKKARELLAYLLEHRKGVTREQIYADLWENSEANVTNLFHTRRGEIRQAFESLGADNPFVYEKGVYRLNMDEIICDHDLFQQAVDEFRRQSTPTNAKRIVDCYTGRYLDDMEALWAESSRLECEDSFLEAADALLENYRNSGERARAIELLRRCMRLSYHGHRYKITKERRDINA